MGSLQYLTPFGLPNFHLKYFSNFLNILTNVPSTKLHQTFYFINFINFLKMLHFLWLAFGSVSPTERLTHFDCLYMLIGKTKLNFYAAVCLYFLCISNLRYIFLKPCSTCIFTLQMIIFKKFAPFLIGPKSTRQLRIERINHHFTFFLSFFCTFIPFGNFLVFYLHIRFAYKIISNWQIIFINFAAIVHFSFVYTLSSVAFFIYFFTVTNSMILQFSICSTLICIFF